MCGIFAAINGGNVTESLLDGLRALSYRGYDSAGIAVIGDAGLQRRRAEGKLEQLARVLESSPLDGSIGIAHTRWATHGSASRRNAHPHVTGRVAVAHNGIIENHQTLRSELLAEGYRFESETDSEVIPLLITRGLAQGMDHSRAMRSAVARLEGSFAVAAIFGDQPDCLYAARHDSPLVIGEAGTGFYLASDANALSPYSRRICHLENGDLACIRRESFGITGPDGQTVQRDMREPVNRVEEQGKEGYRHYMLKEIHEQPEVVQQTLAQFLAGSADEVRLARFPLSLEHIRRLSIVACGTSLFAGMVGRYWLEGFAGLPCETDIASEYRYRDAPLDGDTRALFISQSGETADTLAALRHTKARGQQCLSIVNVADSSMALESDLPLHTLAGPEIGVASTKAFTAQLAVLLMLTLNLARANRRIDGAEEQRLLRQLDSLPALMRQTLALQDSADFQAAAATLQKASNILYLGRGIAYPLAQEGALKLKEISYIHAEAYPAGELKHGPIALIDEQIPVVVIAPPGPLFGKTLSNLREVAARGARILLISDRDGIETAGEHIQHAVVMPEVEPLLQPLLYALPLQLLAYRVALLKGTDVDQPRNLAKSVTVE